MAVERTEPDLIMPASRTGTRPAATPVATPAPGAATRRRRGTTVRRNPAKRKRRSLDRSRAGQTVARLTVEVLALTGAALVGVISALGHAAESFAGASLWHSLLPFAVAVLTLVVSSGALLAAWIFLHRRLSPVHAWLPAGLATVIALASGWATTQPGFRRDLVSLRLLVGGSAEAERVAIGHQVFAAYRRADLGQLQKMFERARAYEPMVREAAAAFGVDAEVLMGVGAAESSFLPRDSRDGGRGLFQITAPPKVAVGSARRRLAATVIDLNDHRHNAFVAAATLRHYLAEMRGDLFLGLLAYNIGPRNGGLLSIMRQYGARDFVTIQPYLKDLPRDYPIRVLSAALAYRLWHTEGSLRRYEDGDNAAHIQQVGIPGLADDMATLRRRPTA